MHDFKYIIREKPLRVKQKFSKEFSNFLGLFTRFPHSKCFPPIPIEGCRMGPPERLKNARCRYYSQNSKVPLKKIDHLFKFRRITLFLEITKPYYLF